MRSLKFIEPGTRAIQFKDRKWRIWHTRPALLSVHFTLGAEYLLITLDQAVAATDKLVQAAVDKVVGATGTTRVIIETQDDRCECDLAAYMKRCGRELNENPRRKR